MKYLCFLPEDPAFSIKKKKFFSSLVTFFSRNYNLHSKNFLSRYKKRCFPVNKALSKPKLYFALKTLNFLRVFF